MSYHRLATHFADNDLNLNADTHALPCLSLEWGELTDFRISCELFVCGANYLAPGCGSNFACGANYPHQALKGGYFVFVWRVGTWLDLTGKI